MFSAPAIQRTSITVRFAGAAWRTIKVWCVRSIARVLIVAVVLYVLKPVMPLIVDGLAHAFWRSVHIAIVHKVNGEEHVHYELRKAADSEKGTAQKHSRFAEDDAYNLPGKFAAAAGISCSLYSERPTAHYQQVHYYAEKALEHPPPEVL